jgi:hypothetical protein
MDFMMPGMTLADFLREVEPFKLNILLMTGHDDALIIAQLPGISGSLQNQRIRKLRRNIRNINGDCRDTREICNLGARPVFWRSRSARSVCADCCSFTVVISSVRHSMNASENNYCSIISTSAASISSPRSLA